MVPDERRHTAVYLMRTGERGYDSSEAGLSEDSKKYIVDLARFEFAKFAFDKILLTPTPVARETLAVFLRSAPQFVLSTSLVIAETPAIYTASTEWGAILKIKPLEKIFTLADLEDAENLAVADGVLSPQGFVLSEGERIFSFISQEEGGLRDQEIMLCLMQKPLPEAVVLWLLKNKISPTVIGIKTPAQVKALKYLDAYILLFRQGQLSNVIQNELGEKVADKREEEAYKLEIKLRRESRK